MNYSKQVKYRILLFFIFIFSHFFSFGQIRIDYTDYPTAGRNYVIATDFIKDDILLESFGSGELDFTAVQPDQFDTVRFLPRLKTRYGRRFPDANLVIYTSRSKAIYLKVDNDAAHCVGVIGDYLEMGAPVLINYSKPTSFLPFPTQLYESHSDTIIEHFISPIRRQGADSIRANIEVIEDSQIDSVMTIRTPYGKYRAIRRKLTIRKKIVASKYSMYGWTPAAEYSKRIKRVIYQWYTEKGGLPIVELEVDHKNHVKYIKYQYDEPMKLSFRARHVHCKGASSAIVDLTVTGGIPDYQFEWSTNQNVQDLYLVRAGTYTVSVIDNRGRKVTEKFTVTEPELPLEATATQYNVSCKNAENGSIDLQIKGGTPEYKISWTNGLDSSKISNLTPGEYRVKIIDKNKCVLQDTFVISEPPLELSAVGQAYNVSCYNGSNGRVELFIDGGTAPYDVQWTNGAFNKNIEKLTAGEYTATIMDKNGCALSKTIKVNQPSTPLEISTKKTDIHCYGDHNGNINLTVKGGIPDYSFAWTTGDETQNIEGLTAGEYSVSVTDNSACTVQKTITIIQPQSPLSVMHQKVDITCFGYDNAWIELSPSGGTAPYKYEWSNGASKKKQKKLIAGDYYVKIYDKNGCIARDTIEIKSPESALSLNYEKQDNACKGDREGYIHVEVSGGSPEYFYNWSVDSQSPNIDSLSAGKYELTIRDQSNCVLEEKIEILEPKNKLVIKEHQTSPLCFGQDDGQIELSISGGVPGYEIMWSNGADTESQYGLAPGTYSYAVNDQNNCEIDKEIVIIEPKEIHIFYEVTHLSASERGGEIEISIDGGTKPYVIIWNDGSSNKSLRKLKPGIYQVTVSDSNGCFVKEDIEVKR